MNISKLEAIRKANSELTELRVRYCQSLNNHIRMEYFETEIMKKKNEIQKLKDEATNDN